MKPETEAAMRDYLERHPKSEASSYPATTVHHIKSRGAGGGDDDDNLLALTAEEHLKVHQIGWIRFCEWYLHLYPKFVNALGRLSDY